MNHIFRRLDGKSVYLCGPIHTVSDDGIGWRDMMTEQLKVFNLKIIDPCKKDNGVSETAEDKKGFSEMILNEDWFNLEETFRPIVRWDLKAVNRSDFLIVNYDALHPLIGTIHEMVVAKYESKPILLKYDQKQLEHFNPWISTLVEPNRIFSNWADMMLYLLNIDDGDFDTPDWI